MDEQGLIRQVYKIVNKNYQDIYAIDIMNDLVYVFDFHEFEDLAIKEKISYTDFIERVKAFCHPDEIKEYFEALSLNRLESLYQQNKEETLVKYKRLMPTGEYRYFINYINYLNYQGKKLIFMISEDVNSRLIDTEKDKIQLEEQIDTYKNTMDVEREAISDALYKVNDVLAASDDATSTRNYINSIFKNVSTDHPELNKIILDKVMNTVDYKKPSILITDDSALIRNTLKRIFQEEFNIIFAKDGKEAVDIITKNISNNNYDNTKENIVGILLDLVMPSYDGFYVLDFMKNNNLFTKVPVAIISGDETKETRRRVYQYDIVDMLEKPFNADNIRRRISKIINLYSSKANLSDIVSAQDETLKVVNDTNLIPIMNQIVTNYLKSKESILLSNATRILTIKLKDKYPEYNIDNKYLDAIVKSAPLYNIGAIAVDENMVITSESIKHEIENGLTIVDNYITDEYDKNIANNIVKYSCEMYDGSGYPDSLKGDNIPIEASIVNMIVRIVSAQDILTGINSILEERTKYNPKLIDALNDAKNDLIGLN
jgi:putative two-component system response regulator